MSFREKPRKDPMDPLEVKRNGYSLADCAEIMRNHSAIKLEHGELQFQAPWQQYLRSQGLTESQWAHVWNDWWQVLNADASLAAKFHTYQSQATVRGMAASQPNVSQSALEGVTLEQFAKIGALIQAGQDPSALLQAERLSMAQWQRGQAAWGQTMGSISPTDPVMLQYALLYQKYNPMIPQAGGGAVSMEEATEHVLDEHAQIHGNRAIEVTLENAESEFFASPIVRHKARGVRAILNLWDRSSSRRASDTNLQRVTRKAYDLSIEILDVGPGNGPGTGRGYEGVSGSVDPMDIHTWSDLHTQEEAFTDTVQTVLSAFKDLAAAEFMTPAQSEQSKAALAKAIQRLTPRKARVEELFRGTRDVTKKTSLRTLLDEYTSVLNDLAEAISDWSYQPPEPIAQPNLQPSAPMFAPAAPSSAMAMAAPQSPLMALLRSLPFLRAILRMLGL